MNRYLLKGLSVLLFFTSVLIICVSGNTVSASDDIGNSSGISVPEIPSGNADIPNAKSTSFYTESDEEYLVFTSSDSEPSFTCKSVCLMLLPDDAEYDNFSDETQWPFYAAIDHFDIVCLKTDWNDTESADKYFKSVYESVSLNYAEKNIPVFIIGYGTGASYAYIEALNNSVRYSGLVCLDIDESETDFLNMEPENNVSDPLSVWLISNKKTSAISTGISYWKNRNSITGSASRTYKQKFADELYMPSTSSSGKITNEEPYMGIVLFSRESNVYTSSMTANISRNFITKVNKSRISFREPVTGGEIHGINDYRFSYNRMQLAGQQRDYWLFTPAKASFENRECSLIVCLHGNGGNGEDMIFRSMWHNIAEKNNCIVVYPSSLYKTGSQHYWENNTYELTFIREMIEVLLKEYNIDRSRIYVTGFSNGAGMAQNLSVRCSDLFAAAALGAPAYFDEEYFGPVENTINEMAIIFSYGSEDDYLKEFNVTANINDIPAYRHLEYWRAMYGFDQNSYSEEKHDIFTMYTFNNKDDIPVVKWFVVEGKGHTYPKEETSLFYDFMKCYTRGTDGSLYYNGVKVRSK